MLKFDIINFLNKNPELTDNGIEWNKNNPRYKEQRVALYESLDEIVKCMDWLDSFYVPSNRKKDETNSYILKHYVEKYFKQYISNGSFVAAYMMKNYDYKAEEDNPVIYIRLHPKPLADHRILYRNR
jgi:hypothetical protein